MSNKKDSRTKAFDAVKGNQKGFKSNKSRQSLVIAIFVVIILILAALSTLIISKVIDKLGTEKPIIPDPPSLPENYTEKVQDQGDIHIGNLLIMNENNKFQYDTNKLGLGNPKDLEDPLKLPDGFINLWHYKNTTQYGSNDASTKITINGNLVPTYQLGGLAVSIVVEENTLNEFNRMLMDYCNQLSHKVYEDDNTNSASGLNIAWGWSDEETLISDVEKLGKAFYDHAMGTTLTLTKQVANNEPKPLTRAMFKSDFKWIYDNAYKYGFIVRYPDDCECGMHENTTERVHLRYVGVEHAYYMKTNNLCLEEYVSLLREQYKFSGEHLTFTVDGKSYEIYYYASSGSRTHVPVPKNDEYTISGNNMDGFIVTVTK